MSSYTHWRNPLLEDEANFRLPFFQPSILLALLAPGKLGAFAPRAEAQVLATGWSIVRYRENGRNLIVHTFTNSAAAETLTFNSDTNVEYLVVAGGEGSTSNTRWINAAHLIRTALQLGRIESHIHILSGTLN